MKKIQFRFVENIKQTDYTSAARDALIGRNPYRHFFYGGAIRGGKTFASLAILVYAAKQYPGSRWHIFRRDMPALQATTIPSMEKLLADDPNWSWNRDKSNYFVENLKNGSRIFFRGEGLAHDPELTDLLGLETNGILFEQIEELSEKLFQTGCSRIGSWLIQDMPKPITLATFNPTQTWVKERIYEPWRTNTLPESFYYMNALPSDNAYVTPEQWQAWEMLESRYRQQYIDGDWTDFGSTQGRWAFAFDDEKHIARPEIHANRMFNLYLSFDFNRNPICCSVIQNINGQIRVIETIKLENSDVFAMCNYILAHYGGFVYVVTGDCTGHHHHAIAQNNMTYYTVIRTQLRITGNQFCAPYSNPRLEDNQVLVNTILAHCDVRINEHKAKGLIYDLRNVKMNPNGTIVKDNRQDPSQQADALDTFRYYCNSFHASVLKNVF